MNLEGLISARLELGTFDRLRSKLVNTDLRPAWRESRKPLRADIRDHAKRQAEPGGTWAPRASSTRRRVGGAVYTSSRMTRRAKKTLGRLPTAFSVLVERRRAILRSRVAWSAIHQEGGRAGHGAQIPRREFLWTSGGALENVAKILAEYIAKAFR